MSHRKSVKLDVMTIATHPSENLERIKTACGHHGLSLHVLGMKDKRIQETKWFFGWKLVLLAEFLEREEKKKKNVDDLLLCIDSSDVLPNLPVQATETIVSLFQAMDTDIVFSAQWQMSPKEALLSPPFFSDERFPSLCAGVFLGTKRALMYYLRNFPFSYIKDDQHWWCERFFDQVNKPRITLDVKTQLFYNMGLDMIDLYRSWVWLEEEKRWQVTRGGAPTIPVRLLEHCISWMAWKTKARCYWKRSATIYRSTPLFLHFEGPGGPKYMISSFAKPFPSHLFGKEKTKK